MMTSSGYSATADRAAGCGGRYNGALHPLSSSRCFMGIICYRVFSQVMHVERFSSKGTKGCARPLQNRVDR